MQQQALLVDDHAIVRAGYRTLLASLRELAHIDEAGTPREAWRIAREQRPALAVVDLHLPGAGGLRLLQRLHRYLPEIRVLIFSANESSVLLQRAMASGASGFVSKRESSDVLCEAVSTVLSGVAYVSPLLQALMVRAPQQVLSPQEHRVFIGYAQGRSTGELAGGLQISGKTVANHLASVREKLALRTRADVVRCAWRHGELPQ